LVVPRPAVAKQRLLHFPFYRNSAKIHMEYLHSSCLQLGVQLFISYSKIHYYTSFIKIIFFINHYVISYHAALLLGFSILANTCIRVIYIEIIGYTSRMSCYCHLKISHLRRYVMFVHVLKSDLEYGCMILCCAALMIGLAVY